MVQLTPSGEVACFVDDDQFHSGESVDKCGPEAVSVFWHSTAPDTPNPYTSSEIHLMAHDDYIKYLGPDVPGDHNGTSDQVLYAMLAEHNFKYQPGPVNMAWVKEQLAQGLPVIIGITESSVHDNQVGGMPYAWNPAGLSHIIIASGAGEAGEILVRDTANIGPQGVRPGPRHYDANRLQLLSATAVYPTWWNATPAPPPPPAQRTYTVQPGDFLGEIAANHGIWPVSKLYTANEQTIEDTARAHGFASSQSGRWIFPGEVLIIP